MAVFEGLSSRLEKIVKKIRGKGRVTQSDIKQISKEIKMALLEADVNYKVVKDFIGKISEKAMDSEVLESLTPGQQIIKIVNEELVEILGGPGEGLNIKEDGTSVIMMCGLQGTGKTTTCGKLAIHMRKKGKKVIMAACDTHRPAAVDQLLTLGKQLDIDVFTMEGAKPESIASKALDKAKKDGYDILIADTSGRLHIDDDMMHELELIEKAINPSETLLVVDAMTGQDAVNAASSFNERIGISGIIMTKMDGDTRGGAALSVKSVTGKVIKFAGTGEKMNDLEEFHPDRMASRILGMGDVLTLIENAQNKVDLEKARKMEKKLANASFTLDDFLEQMEQLSDMGPLDQILGMMPGVNQAKLKGLSIDEKQIARTKAIIQSMTQGERRNPKLLDASRRKRIAAGSGNSIQNVNRLVKDFESMKKMMKKMSGKSGRKLKGMKLPF